mmetsp:Transcript_42847/g.77095  ORF Transcript_42847/g.77095 Transcript_42847/m.77095 type:complete len:217 (-) Transcript_42847:111-761(-)
MTQVSSTSCIHCRGTGSQPSQGMRVQAGIVPAIQTPILRMIARIMKQDVDHDKVVEVSPTSAMKKKRSHQVSLTENASKSGLAFHLTLEKSFLENSSSSTTCILSILLRRTPKVSSKVFKASHTTVLRSSPGCSKSSLCMARLTTSAGMRYVVGKKCSSCSSFSSATCGPLTDTTLMVRLTHIKELAEAKPPSSDVSALLSARFWETDSRTCRMPE